MNYRNFSIKLRQIGFVMWFSVFPALIFGQYQGSPVKKSNLLKVLGSKQFQTRDIIEVINESGVDFELTGMVENELVAAGARPGVIEAIKKNYRQAKQTNAKATKNNAGKTLPNLIGNPTQPMTMANTYNSLLEQAINAYDVKKDRQAANDALQEAVKMQPTNPRAYQLLGFLNLYGAHNFDEAERYWKTAINYGGSAVLRVKHDHNVVFLTTCQGSLYISKNTVRYESDDNKHTLETTDVNIKKIEVTNRFKRLIQLKSGSFKIVLREATNGDETNFSFAPLSGSTDESKMIIRLIGK